ncbi:hypothetical protein LMIY3S_03457 [Labrys miyagiensis]
MAKLKLKLYMLGSTAILFPATIAPTVIAASPAAAQSVSMTGSNSAIAYNHTTCDVVTISMNPACGLVITSIANPTNGATYTNTARDLVVGTNRTDSNSGPTANGRIEITNGGVVTTGRGWLGYEAGTTGIGLISGPGSLWKANGTFNVGFWGDGYLTIQDGGHLQTNNGYIGHASYGEVLITGVHDNGDGTFTRSTWDRNGNQFQSVGGGHPSTIYQVPAEQGTGVLTIEDGGLMKSAGGFIGAQPGATGIVTVSGIDAVSGYHSEWQSTSGMYVGWQGTGTLNILEGGQVTSAGGAVGYSTGAAGHAVIDGASSLWNAGTSLTIGNLGTGVVDVSNDGTLQVSGSVLLGLAQGSSGTLNVGAGGRAGIVAASSIIGGAGTAVVNFNHVDDIDFTVPISGTTAVNQMNSGTTTLFGSNTYSGLTTVSAGTLRAGAGSVFSASSIHDVGPAGTLDLQGFDQTVAGMNNAGLVATNGTGPGTTLTVTGNYVGQGGTLALNTYLGDDASPTDMMVVNGDASGSTTLSIANAGGPGALTTKDGIKVVQVDGNSTSDAFRLARTLTAGAYDYNLFYGGVTDPGDQDWYLRSVGASASTQTALPYADTLVNYAEATLGTLQQRTGNRVWPNGTPPEAIWCKDPSRNFRCTPTGEQNASYADGRPVIYGQGAWGRIGGQYASYDPRTGSAYTQSLGFLQAGYEGVAHENGSGELTLGAFATIGTSRAEIDVSPDPVTKAARSGKITSTGYGLGGNLTWLGQDGFYADAVGQFTWYESDLSNKAGGGNSGWSSVLSLEAGRRFELGSGWALVPQAQLAWAHVDFDSFTDLNGARVALGDGDSLKGRLGLRVENLASWKNQQGRTDRLQLYAVANLSYQFLDGTSVEVAGSSLTQQNKRLWGEVGLGGSYAWNDEWSLYGEADYAAALSSGSGDNYALKGTAGLRYRW